MEQALYARGVITPYLSSAESLKLSTKLFRESFFNLVSYSHPLEGRMISCKCVVYATESREFREQYLPCGS